MNVDTIHDLTRKVIIPIDSKDDLSIREYVHTFDEHVDYIYLFGNPIALIYLSTYQWIDNYIKVFAPLSMIPDGELKRVIPPGEDIGEHLIAALTEIGYELTFLEGSKDDK